MARDRNKRLIILIALIAVVGTSIAFATVSSSLLIKSGLSVSPNPENFSVVFSKSSTEKVEGTVEPTTVPDTLEADDATITNNGSFPTISDINVVFKEPGQSVTYSFYALNDGKYDAYLTSVILQNLNGSSSFIKCQAMDGATQASADSACSAINVKVTVGNLSVSNTTSGIENHKLLKGKSEAVSITIEYASTAQNPDGPVEVYFGNIYLTYGTQMTDEIPDLPATSHGCYLVSGTGSSVGDQIACEEENFYVIESTSSTITMMAAKNITLPTTVSTSSGGEYPKQSDDAGSISFSNQTYWYADSTPGYTVYPLYVYDERSNLYPYVEAYEDYLISLGASSADAKIPSLEQIENLGCTWASNGMGLQVCRWYGTTNWKYSTNYWVGTVGHNNSGNPDYNEYPGFVWVVEKKTHGGSLWFGGNKYYPYIEFGIRPVVTISKSDL